MNLNQKNSHNFCHNNIRHLGLCITDTFTFLFISDKGAVRSTATRSAVDLSQFFVRYGDPEEEAVAAFDFLDEINPKNDFVDHTTEFLPNQSNISSHDTRPELPNKGPDNIILSNVSEEKRTISENSETIVKSQEVKTNDKGELKIKPVKPEKKFFNFTRSKSTKSSDASVKEKESKLPKKIKIKETKEKELVKEKSKIPKFRSASKEQKVTKQMNTKTIQDVIVKSTGCKSINSQSGSHEQTTSFKINNKVVDKL